MTDKNKLIARLQVSDRYIAAQWDYKKHSNAKKMDKQRIDGTYSIYAIRAISFFKNTNKYSLTVNGLALKTEEKIQEVIVKIHNDLTVELNKLLEKHPLDTNIVVSAAKTKKYSLVLPKTSDVKLSELSLQFMQLFALGDQISQHLYQLNKIPTSMGGIDESKFRNLRFDLLRPLRKGMGTISQMSKKFHQVRKSLDK